MRVRLFEGELLLDLRYLRNIHKIYKTTPEGELLLGLPYLRNEWNAPRLSVKVNYCLDYGSSETKLVLRTFQAG